MSLEGVVGTVEAVDDLSGPVRSNLYGHITPNTASKIFQTDLTHRYGRYVKGSKAVVVQDDRGELKTAFLTEATLTHHRHVAATLFGLDDSRAQGLYWGDVRRSCDFLQRCAGFQIQYSTNRHKVIGIQQDSWMTNRQLETKSLDPQLEETFILELMSKIDPRLLVEPYKSLEIENDFDLFKARLSNHTPIGMRTVTQ